MYSYLSYFQSTIVKVGVERVELESICFKFEELVLRVLEVGVVWGLPRRGQEVLYAPQVLVTAAITKFRITP